MAVRQQLSTAPAWSPARLLVGKGSSPCSRFAPALQVIIYSALGFEVPLFGHVSLILAPDHSKLSKRHGAASVGDFERQGYLPDAMVNFLALLGWNDGSEKETFTRTELIQAFSLER